MADLAVADTKASCSRLCERRRKRQIADATLVIIAERDGKDFPVLLPGTTSYFSDPSPTNIARTLSESSGTTLLIRSSPARPSSSFRV